MGRPTGVTVIAVLDFLGTGFCLLIGLGMILGGGFLASWINQQGGQGSAGAAGIMAGLGAAAGVFIIIIGGVCAVLGIGLWKVKEWGRIVNMILWGLGGLLQVLGLLGTLAHFTVLGFLWNVFWLAVDAFVVWYLLKPEVKAAFQAPQTRAASA
ncbi:MAG TPA: hypothetical protein VHW72_00880 [Candidatus Angelobacter sp.]|jgi:hypothetical protein|nr:hypothetical protein [Candidatus Angelobacter sp.]